MKLALAQINTTVGDLAGNRDRILAAYRKGVAEGVELVVVPELALTGYPPRDLLLRRRFVDLNLSLLEQLASQTGKTGLVVGYVGRHSGGPGRQVTNSVALLHQGKVVADRSKTLLPTYDVFDEDRYFEPAAENLPVDFQGKKIGLTVCEDLWNDEDFWKDRRYRKNPAADLVKAGAQLLVNISASPWHLGKNRVRHGMLASLASKLRVPLAYCNLVGGNDELVFDGTSLVYDSHGRLMSCGRMFDEDFLVCDTEASRPWQARVMVDEEKVYRALVVGLRDYVTKCGFKSVLLGLSGGIDSALTAAIAVDAFGPGNVRGVSLPSQFSSKGSLEDAQALARNLGIQYDVISIQSPFESVKTELREVFQGRSEDVTEENVQARLRGVVLMALSNKFGSLLLTTGNKSEMAVGYCTLYGDMCGGLSVISDVPKTMVYRLAKWVNRERIIIPEASLFKAPSAELRPNQTDQDSLPPYDILDSILEAYVVEGRSVQEILSMGQDPETVAKVVRLIDQSEYKRRQASPGLKVTTKAFGMGRRVPIAHRYHDVVPTVF